MSACLRPDEIIDVLDGVAGREAVAHIANCATCQTALDDVRDALTAAEGVHVPEPSPLFWSQMNARVRAAIGEAPRAEAGWWSWLRFDVVVPLAGLATIVMALTTAVGRAPAPVPAPTPPVAAEATSAEASWVVDEPATRDGALELMLDLAATLPDSEWDTLGVATLPDLGVVAQALSADEQQALSALLRTAVERPQS